MFNKTENNEVPLTRGSSPFMDSILVSTEGVITCKLLTGLNPSKALGPDELHPRVLKELANELGQVFAHLFQQSLDTGEIPKEWLLTNICPLFKKGDRAFACNYRPVSLTCMPCKLLEHIVCLNIMAHLDEYQLLSDRQHAFRKRQLLFSLNINDISPDIDSEKRLFADDYVCYHEIRDTDDSLKLQKDIDSLGQSNAIKCR